MPTQRLDKELVKRGLAQSRSQAENFIKLGYVSVNGQQAIKSGQVVKEQDFVAVSLRQQYVSRAGLKLASVADRLKVSFKGKIVLDVGSSTGGFTDYALQNGATRVIAVDTGTEQLHASLRDDPRIELHEQTDIRHMRELSSQPDIAVIDVSFISLRQILPHIKQLCGAQTDILAMVKPQFETGQKQQKNRGIIKNERQRREILKDFEAWVQKLFKVVDKADSAVAGGKGNLERFYHLKPL